MRNSCISVAKEKNQVRRNYGIHQRCLLVALSCSTLPGCWSLVSTDLDCDNLLKLWYLPVGSVFRLFSKNWRYFQKVKAHTMSFRIAANWFCSSLFPYCRRTGCHLWYTPNALNASRNISVRSRGATLGTGHCCQRRTGGTSRCPQFSSFGRGRLSIEEA